MSGRVVSAETVADVLREARALIDTPAKWAQGPRSMRVGPETLCVGEAVRVAQGFPRAFGGSDSPAYIAFRAAIGWAYVGPWNDAFRRTHADVLGALDRAIAAAESSPEGVSS